jgi:hypothetical protein
LYYSEELFACKEKLWCVGAGNYVVIKEQSKRNLKIAEYLLPVLLSASQWRFPASSPQRTEEGGGLNFKVALTRTLFYVVLGKLLIKRLWS